MAKSPISVIYDSVNSAFAKFLVDGSDSLLATASKLRNVAGTIINPSTEDKQDDAITKLTSIDGKDFATETTLTSIKDTDGVKKITDALPVGDNVVGRVKVTDGTDVADIETNNGIHRLETRGSITSPDGAADAAVGTSATETSRLSVASRLTDGVDWLSSILNNTIRRLETRGSITSPDGTVDADVASTATANNRLSVSSRLTDGVGWIATVVNNAIRRLEARSSITSPDGTIDVGVVTDSEAENRLQAESKVAIGTTSDDLLHLEAIDIVSGIGRLKATIYTPDGDPVAFGAISSSLKNDYVTNGGSNDLLVDGSVTPVVFEYLADTTYDVSLQEIRFTMASNSITFGTGYFGATSGPLTNGVLVQVISDGDTITLYNLQRNEHFINFSSSGGWEWIVSNKDVMTSAYLIGGGVKLHAGTTDKVVITVRDDIDSAGLYFACFVKGNLLLNV